MPPRVQPRLFYGAILGGLLIAFGSSVDAGFPGGEGTGGAEAASSGAAAAGAAASGGGRSAGVVRSAAPAETGRAFQAGGGVAREAAPQNNAAPPRAVVANQGAPRVSEQVAYRNGGAIVASSREAASTESREADRPANAWTDSAGTGRGAGFATGRQNVTQNGNRRSRNYRPYLYRFYGGYYPIYVDVPVSYYAPDVDTGYDGGPGVVPDPGSGVSPVIAPSSISVSPQDDGPAQPAPNAEASPAPDAAQDGSSRGPNPSIGPDSLVEAVQAELTRRGYYQGKVDAMFRADTEAALRRFQQDNYLAPTGHLNEPTLHALNLD